MIVVLFLFKLKELTIELTINFFKHGNRSDVIGFDLAETFTRPALECSDQVSINI
jgi:hypothetical protein